MSFGVGDVRCALYWWWWWCVGYVVVGVGGWEQAGKADRSAEGIKFSGWAWHDRRALLGATIDDDDEHIDGRRSTQCQRGGKSNMHHLPPRMGGWVLYTHPPAAANWHMPCAFCRIVGFPPTGWPRRVPAECPYAFRGVQQRSGGALAPLKARPSTHCVACPYLLEPRGAVVCVYCRHDRRALFASATLAPAPTAYPSRLRQPALAYARACPIFLFMPSRLRLASTGRCGVGYS